MKRKRFQHPPPLLESHFSQGRASLLSSIIKDRGKIKALRSSICNYLSIYCIIQRLPFSIAFNPITQHIIFEFHSKKYFFNLHKIPKNYAEKRQKEGKCKVRNTDLPDSLEFSKTSIYSI